MSYVWMKTRSYNKNYISEDEKFETVSNNVVNSLTGYMSSTEASNYERILRSRMASTSKPSTSSASTSTASASTDSGIIHTLL